MLGEGEDHGSRHHKGIWMMNKLKKLMPSSSKKLIDFILMLTTLAT